MGYGYSVNVSHFTGKKSPGKSGVRKKNPRSARVRVNKYTKQRDIGKEKIKLKRKGDEYDSNLV